LFYSDFSVSAVFGVFPVRISLVDRYAVRELIYTCDFVSFAEKDGGILELLAKEDGAGGQGRLLVYAFRFNECSEDSTATTNNNDSNSLSPSAVTNNNDSNSLATTTPDAHQSSCTARQVWASMVAAIITETMKLEFLRLRRYRHDWGEGDSSMMSCDCFFVNCFFLP
jgi:hypothetical protein